MNCPKSEPTDENAAALPTDAQPTINHPEPSFTYTDRVRMTLKWLNTLYETFKDYSIDESFRPVLAENVLPVVVDLVLQPEWRKINQRCHRVLVFMVGRLVRFLGPERDWPIKNIVNLINEPWSQHMLISICNKSPAQLDQNKVHDFFTSQSRVVCWMRFKFIIENDRKFEIFYGYAYWFIRLLNDPVLGEMLRVGTTAQRIEYLTDSFVKRLYKLKTTLRSQRCYIEMVNGLPTVVLYAFILRVYENEATTYAKMLLSVVVVLIGRHLSQEPTLDNQTALDTYLNLFWDICKLNGKTESFVENIKEFCRLTPTAVYIYSFAKFIFQVMANDLRDTVIDLYTRGIITDANAKDNAREVKKDANLVREISQRLSDVFDALASMFDDKILIKREFVLNAFCVHPTKENYEKLHQAYLAIGMNAYKAYLNAGQCDLWHETVDPEFSRLEEIKKCGGERVWSCKTCSKLVKPMYDVECCETDVESRYLKPLKKCVTSEHLFDDLSSAIQITRGKSLHWDMSWPDIELEAKRLMAAYEDSTNLISKELEYLNIDFNQLLDDVVEEEKAVKVKASKKTAKIVYYDEPDKWTDSEDYDDDDDYTYSVHGHHAYKRKKPKPPGRKPKKGFSLRKPKTYDTDLSDSDVSVKRTAKRNLNMKKSIKTKTNAQKYVRYSKKSFKETKPANNEESESDNSDNSELSVEVNRKKPTKGLNDLSDWESIDTDYDPYESKKESDGDKKSSKKLTSSGENSNASKVNVGEVSDGEADVNE